jgi:DNA-3-methyladenine glycosylase
VRVDPDGGRRVGRIVEVEAYGGPEDAASHARHGPTARTRVMFGPPGFAYVYRVYGMHDCLNVVSGPDGFASAVLLRAVEPIDGVERMRLARATRAHAGTAALSARPERLASGPGRLGAAFSVDRQDTGLDLCDPASPLHLEPDPGRSARDGGGRGDVVATARVGVAYAAEPWGSMRWRLALVGSPSVSGPRQRSA